MSLIEYATLDDMATLGDLSDANKKILAEYLSHFVKPIITDDVIRCPCCNGYIQSGDIIGALRSVFKWGLAHGEGFCSECDWPFRMYHYLKFDTGEKKMTVALAHRCYTDSSRKVEIVPGERKVLHERS